MLRQARREDFVLSTEVGRYLVPIAERDIDRGWFKGGLNFQPVTDYGYDATMRSVEQSYHRLGLNGAMPRCSSPEPPDGTDMSDQVNADTVKDTYAPTSPAAARSAVPEGVIPLRSSKPLL